MAKVGVLRFLGTNCDRDIWQAVEDIGFEPEWLWYQDQFNCEEYKALVLPGGFSYGDYLRSGALAAKSPSMKSVAEAAEKGIPILGICNGFQILCDSGLLPGALIANENHRFIDRWVDLKVENTCEFWGGRSLDDCTIPIAHGEGNYFIPEEDKKKLFDKGQIWLTYKENPNGSMANIAGVFNENKNVAGLMPHPERAMHDWMGNNHGRIFFESLM